MNDCICEGNWRNIISKEESRMGRIFENKDGKAYRFIGVLWAEDDFYYAMLGMDGKLHLLSCVANIEEFGYKEADN